MRTTDGGKRCKSVKVNLTEKEYERVRERAAAAEMTMADLMRRSAAGEQVNLVYTVRSTFPDVTEAVMEMGRIMSGVGQNLGKIARWLAGGNGTDETVRAAVMQMRRDMGGIRRKMNELEEEVNRDIRVNLERTEQEGGEEHGDPETQGK